MGVTDLISSLLAAPVGVALIALGIAAVVKGELPGIARGWRGPGRFGAACLLAGFGLIVAVPGHLIAAASFGGALEILGLALLVSGLVVAHFAWPYRPGAKLVDRSPR